MLEEKQKEWIRKSPGAGDGDACRGGISKKENDSRGVFRLHSCQAFGGKNQQEVRELLQASSESFQLHVQSLEVGVVCLWISVVHVAGA